MGRGGAVRRGLRHAKQTVPWTPLTPTSFHGDQSKRKMNRADTEDTCATVIAHAGPAAALSWSQPPQRSRCRRLPGLRPCVSQCRRTRPSFEIPHRGEQAYPQRAHLPQPPNRGTARASPREETAVRPWRQENPDPVRLQALFSPAAQVKFAKSFPTFLSTKADLYVEADKQHGMFPRGDGAASLQTNTTRERQIVARCYPTALDLYQGQVPGSQLTLRSHTFSRSADELL